MAQKFQRFQFPDSQATEFNKIRNVDHLRSLLQKQNIANQIYQSAQKMFKINYIQNKTIVANCKAAYCKAQLRYKISQNGYYKAQLIQRVHNHVQSSTSITFAIKSFIEKNKDHLNQESLKKIIIKQFNVTPAKFYYQYKKVTEANKQENIIELITNLKALGNDIRTIPQDFQKDQENIDKLPDMIIIISPQMKEGYKKYGQFFAFDVTYNLVKDKFFEKDQLGINKVIKWGLGLMMGKNNHNKIIPFGMVLTNCQNNDAFGYMFGKFFQMMGKPPQTIISDQQITIKTSLEKLKREQFWSGQHLLDVFHLLQNIRLKMKNKQIFQALRRACSSITHDEYIKQVNTARMAATDDIQTHVVQDFVKNAPKYCITESPIAFTGITISTSFSQSTNGLIKRVITHQKSYGDIINKILKIMSQLYEKSAVVILSKQSYHKTFSNDDLLTVRLQVCQKIMIAFMQRYTKALSIELTSENNHYKYTGVHEQYFILKNGEKWFCTCRQNLKTGIPCIHQIKAIIQNKQCSYFMEYIHERWHITLKNDENQKKDGLYDKSRGKRPKILPSSSLNQQPKYRVAVNQQKSKVTLQKKKKGRPRGRLSKTFILQQDLSIS